MINMRGDLSHQIYTPIEVVEKMLLSTTIPEGKILEPCAGEGHILDSLLVFIGEERFYRDVTACELDPNNVEKLREKFPGLTVIEGDTLKTNLGKFSYIIGNPPYVAVQNLETTCGEGYTSWLRSNFSYCKGRFDLFMAFTEFCVNSLEDDGKLVFIQPNSWLKSAAAKTMREDLGSKLEYLHDYKTEKVFNNADTYTAIFVIGNKQCIAPWEKQRTKQGLGEATLQNGISTNRDSVFIGSFDDLEDTYIKDIYKASTGAVSKCIYPYVKGVVVDWDVIKATAPKTAKYLSDNKEELLKRDIKGITRWYEFGRSQGLKNMHLPKLAISNINPIGEIRFKLLGPDTVVYSGIYAVEDLAELITNLEKKNLTDYITEFGGDKSGGYKTLSTTLLNNY